MKTLEKLVLCNGQWREEITHVLETENGIFLILFSLNIFCVSSIVKKASSLFESLSSLLPGTNQYWCLMEKHGRDPGGARTHDLWDERQTP